MVGAMRKALHRLAAYEGQKKPNDNEQRSGPDIDPWNEVESACAEYSVSFKTHRHWLADFSSKKKTVDIAPDIEVRFTKYANGHLLIYDEDLDDCRYVLVTGALPEYSIRGWLLGKDCKLVEYYAPLTPDRPPVFKVPQSALRPIEELILL